MNRTDFAQGLFFGISAYAVMERGARYAMLAASPIVGAALLPGLISAIGCVAFSALSLGAAYLANKGEIEHSTAISATIIFSILSVTVTVVALAIIGSTPAMWGTLLVFATLGGAVNIACAILRKNNPDNNRPNLLGG